MLFLKHLNRSETKELFKDTSRRNMFKIFGSHGTINNNLLMDFTVYEHNIINKIFRNSS